jgi:hypothetical protein
MRPALGACLHTRELAGCRHPSSSAVTRAIRLVKGSRGVKLERLKQRWVKICDEVSGSKEDSAKIRGIATM